MKKFFLSLLITFCGIQAHAQIPVTDVSNIQLERKIKTVKEIKVEHNKYQKQSLSNQSKSNKEENKSSKDTAKNDSVNQMNIVTPIEFK